MARCTEVVPLFEMYRGDDKSFAVSVVEKTTGDPVDLTGWAFKSTVKALNVLSEADDTNAAVQVDVAALAGAPAVAGTFTLTLDSAQTVNLVPGTYYFDVQAEINGAVTTVLAGNILVVADATRRTG